MGAGPSYHVRIEGLEELVKTLTSSNQLDKFKPDIQFALDEIHNSLKNRVNDRYAVGSGGSISTALKNKSFFSASNRIQGSLFYEDKDYRNGIYFLTATKWGNIAPLPKKRLGRIVYTTIKKGKQKLAYGKYGFGAFEALNQKRLLERKSAGRNAELRVVLAPSRSQMVKWVAESDKKFKQDKTRIIDHLADRIIKNLFKQLT